MTHLALHQYFCNHSRPVPRFLFLDQPTQVFYPPDQLADRMPSLDDISDDDRASVARMFDRIFAIADELGGAFQIIITDHADLKDDRFQSSVVERWRDGNALVPADWHSREDPDAESIRDAGSEPEETP